MLPETHPTTYRRHEKLRATHPFYACWYNLYQRCSDTGHAEYANYGGRGITVSKDWALFDNFYRDMWPSWQKGLELDRKDNDGPYNKENCRWVTHKENTRNTRRTKLTAEQVAEIRKLYGTTSNKQLGLKFGVNASHICRVAYGEKWAD